MFAETTSFLEFLGDRDEVVADIEADGFDPDKIWVMSCSNISKGNLYSITDMEKLKEFLTQDKVLIMHNGYRYDIPALEKVLGIKVKAFLIDTLALSWYLYPTRNAHDLETWGEEFNVLKPKIMDHEWKGPLPDESYEDFIKKMSHRCEEDVKINLKLWQKMKKDLNNLYGKDQWWNVVAYLSFKMRCAALKEKSRWKLDIEEAKKLKNDFEQKIAEYKSKLQAIMPKVPKKTKKVRPKKLYKKDGTLNSYGVKWQELTKERGLPLDYSGEIEVITGYDEPNAGSHQQLKDWLFSMGWKPDKFDYKRNKETGEVRKIPQIKDKDTGELSDSVKKLAEEKPELKVLEELSVVSHRKSIIDGFLGDVDDEGFVKARVQGLTNTLRWKHKVCLNLPSTRKPYGKEIRGLLTARSDDFELLGSDMSSLEDRTKQHYMWKHDPEYVKTMMSPDFDPHCDIALEAGIMSEDEVKAYKWLDAKGLDEVRGRSGKLYVKSELSQKRHKGKSTNYSATYLAGPPTIARSAGVPESEGKVLHKAYWDRNWALKAIADECTVKQSRGIKWLWNPVANMWYYLKAEKDRFSTLNQGTGTFCFDLWVKFILEARPQLTADFHDEVVLEVRKGNRDKATKLLKDCVGKVNDRLKLNRELDVDVSFGPTYADIH